MKRQDANPTILIFGGAGFIGSNWASWLLENTNSNVHIFDNLSRQGVRHNLQSLRNSVRDSSRLKISIADVRDQVQVTAAVRDAQEIFHFAAQVAVTTSMDDPQHDFDVNLRGTFNILEAIRKAGHKPFLLFTSTNKVYGKLGSHAIVSTPTRYEFRDIAGVSELQPLDFHSPYGCSKGAADQYVHDYARIFDIPAVVFRMSCIAGQRQLGNEDQGWVAHFLYSALQKLPLVIYGDGRQVRDVLSVDDLVRAFDLVRKNQSVTRGQVYNVGGGLNNSTSLLELIAQIELLTERKVPFVLDEARPGDQLVYVTEYSKLRRDTGWSPQLSVLQTLDRIYEWWNRNREIVQPGHIVEPSIAPAIHDGAAA